jgi:hypothetical protein
MQVTLHKKRLYPRRVLKVPQEAFDEVAQGVRDWYKALGQDVPEADLAFLRAMKAADAAAEEVQATAVVAAPIEEVPPHGTPEFWAWCRRRRAAKNAERAAAGLPPLPTAAEKKAAALKKAAEKAAKTK